jgi:hypothetical protein
MLAQFFSCTFAEVVFAGLLFSVRSYN